MRHEPIEIAMTERAQGRRPARRMRRAAAASNRVELSASMSDAIDAAFADMPLPTEAANDSPSISQQNLFAQLTAQVVAIDRHCQQLSQFIKNLDADANRRD